MAATAPAELPSVVRIGRNETTGERPTPMHATQPAARRAPRKSVVAWHAIKDNFLLVLCALIGFAVSYQTIVSEATSHKLPGWPELYPILIDVGILALANEARKAIADGRSDVLPRVFSWVLSAFTLYVNVHGARANDWVGRGLHVVAPTLWITFLELTRWRRVKKARSEQLDRIPVARWLLAPRTTAAMKRRMILHRVKSYPVASAREEAIIVAIGLARWHWPDGWQGAAPPLLAHYLDTGTLPPDVASACETAANGFGVSRVAESVQQWIVREFDEQANMLRQRLDKEQATGRSSNETKSPTAKPPSDRKTTRKKAAKPRRMNGAELTAARVKAIAMLTAEPVPGEQPPTLNGIHEATGLSVRTLSRMKVQLS